MKEIAPSKSLRLQFLLKTKVRDFNLLCDYLIQWSCGSWVESLHPQSLPCQGWRPCTLQKRRYYVNNFSCNLTIVRSQEVVWLFRWLPVTIGHHPTKYGGHRLCRRGEIIFLIWHMTTCDHVIKESRNLILGFVSLHVSTL